MSRKFCVTRYLDGEPFRAWADRIYEALLLVQKASGRELERAEYEQLTDIMFAMINRDADCDCSLSVSNSNVRVSLSYLDPAKVLPVAS